MKYDKDYPTAVEMEEMISHLKAEVEKFRRETKRYKKEYERINEIADKNTKIEKKLRNKSHIISKLEESNANLVLENELQRKRLKSIEKKQSRFQELYERLESKPNNRRSERSGKSYREIESLKSLLKEKEESFQQELEQLQEKEKLQNQELQQLQETIGHYKEKEQQLNQEISRLQTIPIEKEKSNEKELQLLRDKVKDFKEKEQSYQQRTKELMDSSKEKELQFTQKVENLLNEKEKLRNQVEQLNLEGIEKEKSFRKQVDEFKDVIKDTKQQLEIYKQEKMKLSDEIEQLKVKLKEQENMYKQLEASLNDSKQKITPPQKTANEVPKFQFPYDLIKQRQNKIEVQENIQNHRLNPQHQNPNHNWQKLSSNTAPTTLKQGHENNSPSLSKSHYQSNPGDFSNLNPLHSGGTAVDPFKKLRR